MRRPTVWLLGLLILAAQIAIAGEPFKLIELIPPGQLEAGESLWLQLTVGTSLHGSVLEVTSDEGEPIATMSPFGNIHPQETYSLPVRNDVAGLPSIRFRIQVRDRDGTLRAPNDSEFLDASLARGRV
jgi:hypothetical protein